MAPIGTVIKNGLLLAVLSAPLLYFAALQFSNGFADLLYAIDGGSDARTEILSDREQYYNLAIIELALGLLASIVGVGIVYMKTLSDTVEDGMIEF